MNCAYCERIARYEVRTRLQRLRLCECCIHAWARRTLSAPLACWLQQLKPPPRTHTHCPFCGCDTETARASGLYGCALCYVWLLDAPR